MAITEYYVDSVSGAGTSPYTTTAGAATDLRNVFTQVLDPVVPGDVIYVLDTHDDRITGGHYTIAGPTSDKTKPVKVLCVSSFTTKAPSTGAKIGTSDTGYDIYWNTTNSSSIVDGLHMEFGDDVHFGAGNNSIWSNVTFKINGTGTSNQPQLTGTDTTHVFHDCWWWFGGKNQSLYFPGLGPLVFKGGGIHASSPAMENFLGTIWSAGRPGLVEVDGFDASNGTATFEFVKAFADTVDGGEGSSFKASGVLLPSGGVMYADRPLGLSPYADSKGCSPIDEDVIAATHYRKLVGDVVDEASIVLDATSDGTTKYSYKFTTTTNAQLSPSNGHAALRYLLAEFWADAGSTLKVHAHHGGVTELLDTQIGIDVEYPDVTNPQLTRNYSTHNFTHAAGAALTTEVDPGWANDLTNPNYYVFTANLSATSPTSGAGVHRVYGALTADETAITAYFDPAVDIS